MTSRIPAGSTRHGFLHEDVLAILDGMGIVHRPEMRWRRENHDIHIISLHEFLVRVEADVAITVGYQALIPFGEIVA